MTDLLNAIIVILNFIVVPGVAYGSQLALGALGVTLEFRITMIALSRSVMSQRSPGPGRRAVP
ncbi:MAG: hypothetical protein AAFP13_00005, partial [Pseudomonadota bacterium]